LGAVIVAGCGGTSDAPKSFLSYEGQTAVFVQWTRIGDDVSGTLSAAEVSQRQAGMFLSAANPPGEVTQQTAPFTGTVRDDSVRLLIGSGAATNRINGRLDDDTLQLTIPQDEGVQTRRLKPASESDYTKAVRDIRDREQQRKNSALAAKTREQRAARPAITRAATAFQKALAPDSPGDPCRYLTVKLKQEIMSFAESQARSGYGPVGRSCAKIARDNEADRGLPLYMGPQGVASIQFSEQVMAALPSPPGAIVTWRPASGRNSTSTSRTPFTKENGRWLVYKCCD